MNKDLKQLALVAYKKVAPSNYSVSAEDAEGALREQFKQLASDFNTYRKNKLEIFEIIAEVVDDVMPKRILDSIGAFAEVKSYAQGNKPKFRKKLGRNNVKRFITKVALGGTYERVRLDSDEIEVTTYAYGGSCYIEFESFLDGNMDFVELVNLIIDGIEMRIYKDIQAALIGVYSSLPAANKASVASFDPVEMRKIITTIKAYGGNANIICTPEFAPSIQESAGWVADADKADMRDQGYVGKFEGANVIILPQSFEDETNTVKVFNPQYAFVIPTGGAADERIVKVLLEGQTIMDDTQNADMSMEFRAYKKLGMTILNTNFFGIYRNTSIV